MTQFGEILFFQCFGREPANLRVSEVAGCAGIVDTDRRRCRRLLHLEAQSQSFLQETRQGRAFTGRLRFGFTVQLIVDP